VLNRQTNLHWGSQFCVTDDSLVLENNDKKIFIYN
jgi:hypothetical protein